jgi:YebC/PmpR family DNA-binding regulatory protein
MSGHSKWSSIKRKKGANDQRRSQIFTKIAREITVAARAGGANRDENSNLRLAVAKARTANMPRDNIDRAIERATSAADADNFDEVRYEGYGPGGVAILIQTLTDNRNRTVGEVRSTLTKAGGNMGDAGSVAWNFSQRGLITIDVEGGQDPDEVALEAIEAGAEDVAVDTSLIEVFTVPRDADKVRQALEDSGVNVSGAEVVWHPGTTIELDEEKALSLLKLIDSLEDLDDVQTVATNADFPDSVFSEA